MDWSISENEKLARGILICKALQTCFQNVIAEIIDFFLKYFSKNCFFGEI
jgi:hypothetical protein